MNFLKNPIGIMQGRLSSPVNGEIQRFPKSSWLEEFPLAKDVGFDLMEWIFEAEEWRKNPIFFDPLKVCRVSREYDIGMISICADFFMNLPLIRVAQSAQQQRLDVLLQLIERSNEIGVKFIVIPFVDNSEIKGNEEIYELIQILRQPLEAAEKHGIELALETSLDPVRFSTLLQTLHHPSLKVNYDIGNSASLGYDTREEICAYGKWIATVHVKDRLRGGGTVPLGMGNANFEATFSELSNIGYQGPFVLQAARNGDEKETAKRYLKFIRSYLENYF